jgi:hypothetical protein
MRFMEINKHFWSLKATNTLLPAFIIKLEAKFQLEVRENKVVNFFPIQVHGPPEIYPWTPKGTLDPQGDHGPQVKNGCSRGSGMSTVRSK